MPHFIGAVKQCLELLCPIVILTGGKGLETHGEIFQVSLYADYAYGELNEPRVNEEETVDYSGYGLGLQFNVPGSLYARFDIASPIGSRDAFNDRDPQYYFRTSYTF